MAKLKILDGKRADELVVLDAEEMEVGQGKGVAIRLQEQGVSWKHARILQRDGGFWIEDLGSTNGTHINGEKKLEKGEPHRLEPNELIFFGRTKVCFLSEDKAAASEVAEAPGGADAAGLAARVAELEERLRVEQAQISFYETDNIEKEQELNKKRRELLAKSKAFTSLSDEVEQLRSKSGDDSESADSRVGELETKLEAERRRADSAESANTDQAELATKLEEQLAELRAKLDSHDDEVAGDLQKAQEDKRSLEGKNEELVERLAAADQASREAQAASEEQVAKLNRELEEARESQAADVGDGADDGAAAAADAEALENERKASAEDRRELERQLTKARWSLDRLETEGKSAAEELELLRERAERVEKERDEAVKVAESARVDVRQAQTGQEEGRSKEEEKRREIEHRWQNSAKRVNELEETLRDRETEQRELEDGEREKRRALEDELRGARTVASEIEAELASVMEKLTEQGGALETARTARDAALTDAGEKEKRLRGIDAELEALRKTADVKGRAAEGIEASFEKERAELEFALEDLGKRVETVTRERDDAIAALDDVHNLLDEGSTRLREAEGQVEAFGKELEESAKVRAGLEETLSSRDSELKQLQEELVGARQEAMVVQRDMDVKVVKEKGQRTKIEEELELAQKAQREAEAESEKVQAVVAEREADVRRLEQDADLVLKEREAERKASAEDRRDLEKQLTKARWDLDRLKADAQNQQADQDEGKRRQDELERNEARVKEELDARQGELDAARSELTAAREERDEQAGSVASLRKDLRAKEREVDTTRRLTEKQRMDAETQRRELESKIAELEAQADKASGGGDDESATKERDEWKAKFEQARDELELVTSDFNEAQDELEKLRATSA